MEFPEAASDLVGRTSARLLAAGVERRERLAALHLLAILDASVDGTGRVRRPLDDLAAEFELEPLSVLRSLDHLHHAGAIDREGPVVVLLGASTTGLGGMQLADFLDDVRASFDGSAPIEQEPRRSPWLVRSGAVLAAAAAAVAVFTLAPTQPATERPLLAARASTTTSVVPGEPSTELPSAAPAPARQPTTTALVPPVDIVPETAIVAASTCPTGEPSATIIDRVLEITNPTTEAVVINGISVAGATLRAPITVPAGGTVTRVMSPLAEATGGASIVSWAWASTDIVRSCPS
jgi:hypothetical protein